MLQQDSRFLWRDKQGRVWEIRQVDGPGMIVFRARSQSVKGKSIASARIEDSNGKNLPFAVLDDIQVDRRMENRGLGSMLLSRVIAICKDRGHQGIEGKLSRTDSDHFDKLKHFYEKHGFTVMFYAAGHPERVGIWLGGIRLEFGAQPLAPAGH